MLVLLILRFESHRHALAGQFAAAQGADADQNLAQRLFRLLGQKRGAEIAVLPGRPFLNQ